jgi:hypothetical protein
MENSLIEIFHEYKGKKGRRQGKEYVWYKAGENLLSAAQ